MRNIRRVLIGAARDLGAFAIFGLAAYLLIAAAMFQIERVAS